MTFMAVSCCWRLLKALKKNTQSKISSFCALGPKKAVKKYKETFVQISASSLFLLLAGQEASCLSLESDDDDGQFEISLLLQLSQNSRPEEHLTLTDAIQVRIQIQVLHLEEERRRQEGRTEDEWNRNLCSLNSIFILFYYSDVIFKVLAHHQTARLLPVHEALRDGVGSQNLVSANKNNIQWNIKMISNTNLHYNLHFEWSLLRLGQSHTQNKLMVNSVDFRFKWKVLFVLFLSQWLVENHECSLPSSGHYVELQHNINVAKKHKLFHLL